MKQKNRLFVPYTRPAKGRRGLHKLERKRAQVGDQIWYSCVVLEALQTKVGGKVGRHFCGNPSLTFEGAHMPACVNDDLATVDGNV